MKEYILKGTDKTPAIHLKDGLIAISGRSIPEDPDRIFRSAHQWVKEYVKNPARHTEVNLQIEYCDSGSTISIFNLLNNLVQCRNSNFNIEMIFNWYYESEDEEILELGKFMESKLNVMFNYIELRYQGSSAAGE